MQGVGLRVEGFREDLELAGQATQAMDELAPICDAHTQCHICAYPIMYSHTQSRIYAYPESYITT